MRDLDERIAKEVFRLAEVQHGHLCYWYTPTEFGYAPEYGSPCSDGDRPALLYREKPESKDYWRGDNGLREVPRYSTDIAAAWLVVEEMQRRGWWCAVHSPWFAEQPWFAGFTPHRATGWNGRADHQASADNAPEAICLAALAAIAKRNEPPTAGAAGTKEENQ